MTVALTAWPRKTTQPCVCRHPKGRHVKGGRTDGSIVYGQCSNTRCDCQQYRREEAE